MWTNRHTLLVCSTITLTSDVAQSLYIHTQTHTYTHTHTHTHTHTQTHTLTHTHTHTCTHVLTNALYFEKCVESSLWYSRTILPSGSSCKQQIKAVFV